MSASGPPPAFRRHIDGCQVLGNLSGQGMDFFIDINVPSPAVETLSPLFPGLRVELWCTALFGFGPDFIRQRRDADIVRGKYGAGGGVLGSAYDFEAPAFIHALGVDL